MTMIFPGMEQACDAGSYRERIDYHSPSEPPLAAEDQTWADALIRAAEASLEGKVGS
jgi:hypothetical protein